MKWHLLAGTSLLALAAAAPNAWADPITFPVTFPFTGAIVDFAVPVTGTYQIIAFGAQGVAHLHSPAARVPRLAPISF
jgi:hypothetical protein